MEGAAREGEWVGSVLRGREGVREVAFFKEGGWGQEKGEGELERCCEERGIVLELC